MCLWNPGCFKRVCANAVSYSISLLQAIVLFRLCNQLLPQRSSKCPICQKLYHSLFLPKYFRLSSLSSFSLSVTVRSFPGTKYPLIRFYLTHSAKHPICLSNYSIWWDHTIFHPPPRTFMRATQQSISESFKDNLLWFQNSTVLYLRASPSLKQPHS